jgi:hypothetical protein
MSLPTVPLRRTLLAAAQAVLAAWDAAPDRPGLPEAVASLHSALAGKPVRPPHDPSTPRKPREGTRQQQVLALLRRPEGATVAQIAEATGWQAHTVRGFFAGLRKRQGIAVEVMDDGGEGDGARVWGRQLQCDGRAAACRSQPLTRTEALTRGARSRNRVRSAGADLLLAAFELRPVRA